MSITAKKEVAKIWITRKMIDYIYKNITGWTKAQIETELRQALGTAFGIALKRIERWIRKYVPKATGNLQDHLIETLLNSPGIARQIDAIGARSTGVAQAMPKRMGLRIGLDPANPVPYAQYVNKMTSSQVRHHGMVTRGPRGGMHGDVAFVDRHGYYGNIVLNDPNAIGNYAGLLRLYAKQQLKNTLQTEINRIRFNKRPLGPAGFKV